MSKSTKFFFNKNKFCLEDLGKLVVFYLYQCEINFSYILHRFISKVEIHGMPTNKENLLGTINKKHVIILGTKMKYQRLIIIFIYQRLRLNKEFKSPQYISLFLYRD